MDAFYVNDDSWLIDIVNQVQAGHLLHLYSGWRLGWEGETNFLTADEGTEAETRLKELVELADNFPLNIREYEEAIKRNQYSAIKKRCESLGTIMNSPEYCLHCLTKEGVEVREVSPMKFKVLTDDDNFRRILEKYSIE